MYSCVGGVKSQYENMKNLMCSVLNNLWEARHETLNSGQIMKSIIAIFDLKKWILATYKNRPGYLVDNYRDNRQPEPLLSPVTSSEQNIFSRVWCGGLQAERWLQAHETAASGEVQAQEHQQVHLLLQEGESQGLGKFVSLSRSLSSQ